MGRKKDIGNMKEIRRLQHLANKILNDINRGAWCNMKEKDELWEQYDKLIEQIDLLKKEMNK